MEVRHTCSHFFLGSSGSYDLISTLLVNVDLGYNDVTFKGGGKLATLIPGP